MKVGDHHSGNHIRIACLSEEDWKVALKKCKTHIRIRLRQRTLYGAHTSSNLGADPIDHYLGIAYEKILAGDWEWKVEYTLAEQLIRIADKFIGDTVDKYKTEKSEALRIVYKDIELDFYGLANAPPDTDEIEYEERLKTIENAISDDQELLMMLEGVKAGYKRSEIADLLDIHPRQLDKLKDKLERKVKKYKSSSQ